MTERAKCCGNCRWWWPINNHVGRGTCSKAKGHTWNTEVCSAFKAEEWEQDAKGHKEVQRD